MDISCYIHDSECFNKIDETKLIEMIIGSPLRPTGKKNNYEISDKCKPFDKFLCFEFGETDANLMEQITEWRFNIESHYYYYTFFNPKQILSEFENIKNIISIYIEKNKPPFVVEVIGVSNDITNLFIKTIEDQLLIKNKKIYFLKHLKIGEFKNPIYSIENSIKMDLNRKTSVIFGGFTNKKPDIALNIMNFEIKNFENFFYSIKNKISTKKYTNDIYVSIEKDFKEDDIILYLIKILILKTLIRYLPDSSKIHINFNKIDDSIIYNKLDINDLIFNDEYKLYRRITLLDLFENFSNYAENSLDYITKKIKFDDTEYNGHNHIFFYSKKKEIWLRLTSFEVAKKLFESIKEYKYGLNNELCIYTKKININILNEIFNYFYENDIPNLKYINFSPRIGSFKKYKNFFKNKKTH